MLKLATLVLLMFFTPICIAQSPSNLPIPEPNTWDMAALDPALALVAEQHRTGDDWQKTAKSRGVKHKTASDGTLVLLFEIAEFGQRTPDNMKPWPNVGPRISERLAGLNEAFTSLEWIPSGSSTYQRGWIAPSELSAFHTGVQAELNLSVTSRWVPPMLATYGSIASPAPANMKADILEELGTKGAGIKIAVIDLEFKGINSTALAEVGTVSTAISASPSQTLALLDLDSGGHGTACVEVIRDIAPDAEILVIREDVSMTPAIAAAYAVSWGADIISRSVNDFFYPGDSPASQAATTTVAAGKVWINSAGNAASGHYWESGSYVIGGTGFVRFATGIEVNQLDTSTIAGNISVILAYEHPSASYAGFALLLYEDSGSGLVQVASGTPISGVSSVVQAVNYTPIAGNDYYVAVFRNATGTSGRMRLASSWATPYTFNYSSVYGSIMNPANTSGVTAVGAVSSSNYTSSASVEGYSSRGGGIFSLDVDFCAPTDCITSGIGGTGFNGTSCACPNFAAFYALHLSRPEYAANPYGFMLATDIMAAGTDNDSGLGIIVAAVDTYESDNTSAKATSLGSSTAFSNTHTITPANDVDWYEFILTSTADVLVETDGTAGDTFLTLYNSSLTQIGSDDNSGFQDFSSLTMPALAAGTYYVKITETTQSGILGYDFILGITRDVPGQVSLLSPGDGTSGLPAPVGVSWATATSTAPISYEIEVATDGGFSSVVVSSTGITGTSFSVNNLASTTLYYWHVRAVNAYGNGTWSSTRTFTTSTGSTSGGAVEVEAVTMTAEVVPH